MPAGSQALTGISPGSLGEAFRLDLDYRGTKDSHFSLSGVEAGSDGLWGGAAVLDVPELDLGIPVDAFSVPLFAGGLNCDIGACTVSLNLGGLADRSLAAFGGGLGFEVDEVLLEHMSIGLDADYLDYLPANSAILSMQQMSFVLTGGYRIAIDSRWTVIPRLGVGYGSGFADYGTGARAGGQGFLIMQGEGTWRFLPDWRLNADLGYRATVEASTWFSAVTLGVGVSWKVPLGVDSSWILASARR